MNYGLHYQNKLKGKATILSLSKPLLLYLENWTAIFSNNQTWISKIDEVSFYDTTPPPLLPPSRGHFVVEPLAEKSMGLVITQTIPALDMLVLQKNQLQMIIRNDFDVFLTSFFISIAGHAGRIISTWTINRWHISKISIDEECKAVETRT